MARRGGASDNYLEVAAAAGGAAINASTTWTLGGWAYAFAAQDTTALLTSFKSSTSDITMCLGISTGASGLPVLGAWFAGAYDNSGSDWDSAGDPDGVIEVGRWVHLAGTHDGSTFQFFKNGKLRSTGASAGNTATGLAFRALHRWNSGAAFNGIGEDLWVYSGVVLTPGEIFDIYTGRRSPLEIRPAKLKGYWPLRDGGMSGKALDRSANQAHLSMTGTVPYWPGRHQIIVPTFIAPPEGKFGKGVSAFVGSGPDATQFSETASGILVSTALGTDLREYGETGTGVSPFVASGGQGGTVYFKSGAGVAPFTTAGVSGRVYIKSGLGASPRAAAGVAVYVPDPSPRVAGTFPIARGRIAGLIDRVNLSDPTNSAIVLVVLKKNGLQPDAALFAHDTLASILSASNDEATNSGYARIVLDDGDGVTATVDDSADMVKLDFPDQIWSSVAAAGGEWGALLVCYDADTTSGTDANVIPLTKHPFVIVPDGRDIFATVDPRGFAVC